MEGPRHLGNWNKEKLFEMNLRFYIFFVLFCSVSLANLYKLCCTIEIYSLRINQNLA